MSYFVIFIELVVGYLALFIIVKILGKTQISQITPFDFISALVLGDLVGSAIFDEKAGLLKIVFSIVVWGVLIYITEMATQKSLTLRFLFEGKPSIIVNHGKLDWLEMKRNHLDIDQLLQLLRLKGVFSLQDVEYAILENNGVLSVLPTSDSDKPTCRDLKIKGEKREIPYTFISDGEVLSHNLRQAGLDEKWLQNQLKARGIHDHKDICYAEWKKGDALYFQKYK